MGDVGMGKTTLCRQLILKFTEPDTDSNEVQTHLLLDPAFGNTREFLSTVAATFGIAGAETAESEWHLKEEIKNYLFQRGVDEKKIVVLIIDEGQKLPGFCREVLREFLNYETNESKLLQIVIFAQNEFRRILKRHANFADRVNQYYFLKPLNFRETMALIRFRLSRSGRPAEMKQLFTLPGLWAVYLATGGYPRKIITLCNQILLTLIIQNKTVAGWTIIRSTTRRMQPQTARTSRWVTAGLLASLALALTAFAFLLTKPPDGAGRGTTGVRPIEPSTKSNAFGGLAVVVPSNAEPPGIGPQARQTTNPSANAGTMFATAVKMKSPGAPASHERLPALLGSLQIRERDEVLRFLLEIYGNTESSRYQAVIRANPHIADMNVIKPGETIVFPAIPGQAQLLATANHWVAIARERTLEEAYRSFKTYPQERLPVRLIPSWTPKNGLAFTIILKRGFAGEEAARDAVAALPPMLAEGAEIMKTPEKDTVYFAY